MSGRPAKIGTLNPLERTRSLGNAVFFAVNFSEFASFCSRKFFLMVASFFCTLLVSRSAVVFDSGILFDEWDWSKGPVNRSVGSNGVRHYTAKLLVSCESQKADDFSTAAQTHSTGRPGDSDDSTGRLGNAAVPDSAGIPGSGIRSLPRHYSSEGRTTCVGSRKTNPTGSTERSGILDGGSRRAEPLLRRTTNPRVWFSKQWWRSHVSVVREKGPIAAVQRRDHSHKCALSHPQATWASATEIRAISFLTRVGCPCSCGIRAPQAARNGGLPVSRGALPHRDDAGSRGLPGPLLSPRSVLRVSPPRTGHHVQQEHVWTRRHHDQHGGHAREQERRVEHHCFQRTFPLPQTTQAWQGHVLGGLHAPAAKRRDIACDLLESLQGRHVWGAKRPVRGRLQHGWLPLRRRTDELHRGGSVLGGAAGAATGLLAALGLSLRFRGLLWLHSPPRHRRPLDRAKARVLRAQSRAGGSRAKGPTGALPRTHSPSGEHTLTAQNALLFSHLTSPVEFTATFVSHNQEFVFQPTLVHVSALCWRRTDILDTLWLTLCSRLTYCNGTLTHCAHHSVRGSMVTDDLHLSQGMSPSKIQWLAETNWWDTTKPRWFLWEDISHSLPAHPSVPSDQFCDIMETTNPQTMQVESVRRRESIADALYGQGGYEHIILRMESQELSTRNKIFWRNSTQRTCSNGKRRSTCVLLSRSTIQNRSQRIPKTGERIRQSRCERIFTNLRSYDDARTSKYSESIWRTFRRAWKKGGTSDWVRSTRCFAWSEKQVHLQEGEREKQFVQSQMQWELHPHNFCYRRTSHDREVQQDTEELMMTSLKEKLPRKLRKWERSCYQRTTVSGFLFEAKCRRHRQPIILENRSISTYQGGGGTKHEEDSRRELFALLICSCTTRNGIFSTLHADRKSWFSFTDSATCSRQPMEHVPATPTALSDTRSVADASTSKRREAEKFEVGQWPQASGAKSVLASSSSMPVAVPLASSCASSLASDFPSRLRGVSRPEKEDTLWSKTVNTWIEDCKVGPEDWLVLNFELSKVFGFVNCQIHQTAVDMRHHPTNDSDVDDFDFWSFYWSSDSLCQSTQSRTPDRSISQEESIYQSKRKT